LGGGRGIAILWQSTYTRNECEMLIVLRNLSVPLVERKLGNTVDLNVFFTPSEVVSGSTDDIYVIIDVIRATTTLTLMFDQGAAHVYAAETVEQAQKAAQIRPGRLLCGERYALPPPGFDYGNSPAQFSQLDLTGRELILATTNGTRALHACPEGATRLIGCFYNAQAVTSWALTLAQEQHSNIAIVCAGKLGRFALDDATCAGYLVLELQRQRAGELPEIPLHLQESAQAALTLYQAYKPLGGFEHWAAAQEVIQAGLQDDLRICMQTSASSSVPVVVGREKQTELLVLEQTSPLLTRRAKRVSG
jgi:2-phosphosulfolactate phosphatase